MAKISRRAVASSSSTSAASSSSSSSVSVSASASGSPVLSPVQSSSAASAAQQNKISNEAKPSSRYVPIDSSGSSSTDPLRGVGSSGGRAGGANTANQFTITTTASNTPYTAAPTPYVNKTIQAQILAAERERIRAEFFATYDVMTGVRIAATLGGFFGLMVFLIVWKSRSSSNETLKVLKDPKMAAVAAVCMQEEEEREIQEAMVATGMSIYPDEYDAIVYRRQRMMSLGNVSAPPMLNRGFRFSSVGGGYSSLLEPPRRFSLSATSAAGSLGGGGARSGRRKSCSESSRILANFHMGSSFGMDDYFIETEDELENGDFPMAREEEPSRAQHKRSDSTKSKQGFLDVPLMGQDSRRSSAMTCCSTESSYLERRCSAFTLGLSHLPGSLQRKLSTTSRTSSTENWDYYYPDIQVIQPTPKPSPCPSERSIYEQLKERHPPAAIPVTATTSRLASTNNQSAIGGARSQGIVRKHSIAYYDPDSAQGGRKQQIHSISADTVDVYPYNQTQPQPQPPVGPFPSYGWSTSVLRDSPPESLQLPPERRKVAVVELPRIPYPEPMAVGAENNNNNFPYAYSTAAMVTPTTAPAAAATTTANSSSISIDSTPISIDKLNGSGSASMGTVSAKALFNADKRAPLASLSSFKISSLECGDSELPTPDDDDDSVFLESPLAADTDEDMQQMSSDSEEASLGPHDPRLIREDTVLVAPIVHDVTSRPGGRQQQPLRYPIEKRLSLQQAGSVSTAGRGRRPLLQRHRTISASSSDRVSLIGQPLKEFSHSGGPSPPADDADESIPLETHFGPMICTNSPPAHPRRVHLLQQYSDPQSMPTVTDDTCSTLNTDLGAGGLCIGSGAGADAGGESTTHTQYSSLQTVVSIGRASPLAMDGVSRASSSPPAVAGGESQPQTRPATNKTTTTAKQLPHSRRSDDPCVSSISDSAVISAATRHPIICMPSSLKSLIIRGSSSTTAPATVATAADREDAFPMASRSATDLSLSDYVGRGRAASPDGDHSTAIALELPLIKLPTDDDSSESSASAANGNGNDGDGSCQKSDESRDPSLPSSSRKWSKETLF